MKFLNNSVSKLFRKQEVRDIVVNILFIGLKLHCKRYSKKILKNLNCCVWSEKRFYKISILMGLEVRTWKSTIVSDSVVDCLWIDLIWLWWETTHSVPMLWGPDTGNTPNSHRNRPLLFTNILRRRTVNLQSSSEVFIVGMSLEIGHCSQISVTNSCIFSTKQFISSEQVVKLFELQR